MKKINRYDVAMILTLVIIGLWLFFSSHININPSSFEELFHTYIVPIIIAAISTGISIFLGNKSLRETKKDVIKEICKTSGEQIDSFKETSGEQIDSFKKTSGEQIDLLKKISEKQIKEVNKYMLSDSYIRIKQFIKVIREISGEKNVNGEHIKQFIGSIICGKKTEMVMTSGWGGGFTDEFNKEGSCEWACFRLAEYFWKLKMGEITSLSFNVFDPFFEYFGGWKVVDYRDSGYWEPLDGMKDRVEINYRYRKIWISEYIREFFNEIAREYMLLIRISLDNDNIESYEIGAIWEIYMKKAKRINYSFIAYRSFKSLGVFGASKIANMTLEFFNKNPGEFAGLPELEDKCMEFYKENKETF